MKFFDLSIAAFAGTIALVVPTKGDGNVDGGIGLRDGFAGREQKAAPFGDHEASDGSGFRHGNLRSLGTAELPRSHVEYGGLARPASSALPIHALRGDMVDDRTGGSVRRLTDVDDQDCPIDDSSVFSGRQLQLGCSSSGAIITNGLIKLGVNDGGELNIGGGIYDALGTTTYVGLRYVISDEMEAESTSYGCRCEGWGARATSASTDYGWANQAGGCSIGSYESFIATADTAVAIVTIPGGRLEVTHDYHPSPATDNMYEVVVTLRNLSGEVLTNIGYRRAMDWDIWPTPFNECSTIGPDPLDASALFTSTNNGFATNNMANPLTTWAGYTSEEATGPFEDLGPRDHGAAFDFDFGDLTPSGTLGEQVQFKIFYGAAPNTVEAEAALGDVGAEVYSLGKSTSDSGGCNNDSVVFIFGFSGVGGVPAFLPSIPDDVTLECGIESIPAIPDDVPLSGSCETGVDLTVEDESVPGTCPIKKTISRNFTATDQCGSDPISKVQTITVQDSLPPGLSSDPPDIIVECDAIPDPDVVTASDACDGAVPVTYNQVESGSLCSRVITRTWTASDSCSNSIAAVQEITVVDTTPPTASCQFTYTANLASSGVATITVDDVDDGSFDSCNEAVTLSLNQTDFKCSHVGDNNVALTVTDACGNAATCNTIVKVFDVTPPKAIEPYSWGAHSCVWPPDGRFHCFNVTTYMLDGCSDVTTVELKSCISNEPADESESESSEGMPDCWYDPNADKVCFRAERNEYSSNSDSADDNMFFHEHHGRIYNATFEVKDIYDNTSFESIIVAVPYDETSWSFKHGFLPNNGCSVLPSSDSDSGSGSDD